MILQYNSGIISGILNSGQTLNFYFLIF